MQARDTDSTAMNVNAWPTEAASTAQCHQAALASELYARRRWKCISRCRQHNGAASLHKVLYAVCDGASRYYVYIVSIHHS